MLRMHKRCDIREDNSDELGELNFILPLSMNFDRIFVKREYIVYLVTIYRVYNNMSILVIPYMERSKGIFHLFSFTML